MDNPGVVPLCGFFGVCSLSGVFCFFVPLSVFAFLRGVNRRLMYFVLSTVNCRARSVTVCFYGGSEKGERMWCVVLVGMVC